MERENLISPDVTGPGDIGRIALADSIRRSARVRPDKTAVVDGALRKTYAELDADVSRLANALLARNHPAGSRIATMCANSYALVVAMFGIQRAGLVWLPINHNLRPDDVDYIFGHAEPVFAIVDEAIYAGPLGTPVDARIGDATIVPSAGHLTGGVGGRYTTLDAFVAGASSEEPNVTIRDRDVAQIMYTSGTTGRPKGVMHTHLSVYLALLGNAIEFETRASDVGNVMLPLFHCAQHTLAAGLLVVGGTLVIMHSVDPAELIETIANEKVTLALSLPPIYGGMLDHPKLATNDLSSLRLCVYGMMQVPEPMLRRLVAEICPRFQLGTGQTEMYPVTLSFKPEDQLRKFGSYWGESGVVTETAIMDDAGNLLPPGESGEIVHRGPNVMAGYFRDPEATEKSRAFGWHHTGDLGHFDADGTLVFTDRKKDMIKSGGENVASIVVERALLAHPAVAAAAAIGLPHARWFEAVTAVVQLKPGAAATEEEILAHARTRLSVHEVPKAVIFVETFPLTATGKTQKNIFRERYAGLYAQAPATV
ncbi:MAG: AMP-binding protein [Candidatus Eremiobacteraeota bacterium]|nr:AMP-binding protein [Candidatus Eremiobacteraeota bacterium]